MRETRDLTEFLGKKKGEILGKNEQRTKRTHRRKEKKKRKELAESDGKVPL